MEPNNPTPAGPEGAPQQPLTPEQQPNLPEVTPEQQPAPQEAVGEQSRETGNQNAGMPAPPPPPPPPPAPVAPQQGTTPDDAHAQAVTGDAPAVADDVDVIEKEWVDKAKKIVDSTQDDPRRQNHDMSILKADYMKKRYGKEIKLPEDKAA